jgi:hypothetical protein
MPCPATLSKPYLCSDLVGVAIAGASATGEISAGFASNSRRVTIGSAMR